MCEYHITLPVLVKGAFCATSELGIRKFTFFEIRDYAQAVKNILERQGARVYIGFNREDIRAFADERRDIFVVENGERLDGTVSLSDDVSINHAAQLFYGSCTVSLFDALFSDEAMEALLGNRVI